MFTIYRRWWLIVLRVHTVTKCYSRMDTGLNNRVLRDESESRIEILHTIYLDCVLAFLDSFYLQHDIAIIVHFSLISTELCHFIRDACSSFLRANYCMLNTDMKLDFLLQLWRHISEWRAEKWIRRYNKYSQSFHVLHWYCSEWFPNPNHLNLFYY